MSDIFISYSRKDSPQALAFGESLKQRGASIWIDQHGIEAAASWSGEIVRAINQCSVFVVMLSAASIRSDNVIRELALALEKKKKILPIELESVVVPESMEYPLAGIQRVAHTDWAAIERVLANAFSRSQSDDAPAVTPVATAADASGRRTIAVLPFENLSADPDNEWFADGLTQEIIGLLSNISSLRVTDRRTAMAYKNTAHSLKTIATELGVEYVMEGTVRKAGTNLRITSELVEVATGQHLWSETFKGTFDDIFDIQERVASSIVEGLDVALKPRERTSIASTPTRNSEAYELYLRARELGYSTHQQDSIPMLERAIELDPTFVGAYTGLSSVYRRLAKRSIKEYADLAYDYALKAFKLDPENAGANLSVGAALFERGDIAGGFRYISTAYSKDPNNTGMISWMGFYYENIKNFAEAARFYEMALEAEPAEAHFMMHLIGIYRSQNNSQALRRLAEHAMPYLELQLRLRSDHESVDMVYCECLRILGRQQEIAPFLKGRMASDDPIGHYNYGCALASTDPQEALASLQKAIEHGFSDVHLMRTDTDLEPLRTADAPVSAQFQDILKQLEMKTNA